MRLPIPIKINNNYHRECEIQAPSPATLADTNKIADSDIYSAMIRFLQGSIKSIDGNEDINKSLLYKMPYRTAEMIAVDAMLEIDDDDGVEGIYRCPLCGHGYVAEKKMSGDIEIDTRDFISSMPVNYWDDEEYGVRHEFYNPIVINDGKGNIIEEVRDIEMTFPTMEHCIKAYSKFGRTDEIRFEFAVYLEAITHVNGSEIDSKFKNRFGMYIFENCNMKKDILVIGENMRRYGRDTTVKRTCEKCGRLWRSQVNTSNFFVSGLRTL